MNHAHSCRFLLFLGVLLAPLAPLAANAADDNPLEPPDTASPRGVMTDFFELVDQAGLAATVFREHPSRDNHQEMSSYVSRAQRLFDMSGVAETARAEVAADAVVLMWEVLSRIELPPLAEIPDVEAMDASIEDDKPARYRIPHTEIAIARVAEGERAGEYLFSPATVEQIALFYQEVVHLPYVREMTIENPRKFDMVWGGGLLPPKTAEALPGWLKASVGGQATWKWLAQTLVLALVLGLVWFVHHVATRITRRHSLGSHLRRLAAPVAFLLLTPLMDYLWAYQIGITGYGARVVQVVVPAFAYLAMAWLVWHLTLAAAETIIASPKIPEKGLDAHLLRLLSRVAGLTGALVILFWGGNRLGIPLYGLIAGVGVGGLAFALAAQGTLENFLGSLNLFADRPVRVGDLCRYGGKIGWVEEIGLRSTRIRGRDRTVTTIPNADFSKMQVTNLSRRERMLLNSVIGLRYETTPDQLRHVLAKLREMLLAHPKVTPEPARARFIGFGDYALKVEVFAYVGTNDWDEFLKIQEDVNLRIMGVIEASGTGFAFPTQTLYLGRDSDRALDPERSAAAAAEVQAWRDAQQLPFPDFDVAFRKEHRDTLDYPPTGSCATKPETGQKID